MPEPTDGMTAMDPSTAGDESAREATPPAADSPETPATATTEGTPVSTEAHPPSTPDADPFALAHAAIDGLPDDILARLAKEHPRLRSASDVETRTLLQRKEADRQREQSRREAMERDLILANEDHERHFELAEQYGTKEVQAARERVGIREALQNPRVKEAAHQEYVEGLWNLFTSHEATSGFTSEDWAALQQHTNSAELLGDLVQRAANVRVQAARAAIEEAAVDRYKRDTLPNPDLGGTRPTSPPNGGRLTPETYRQLWATNPAAARQLPPAEIDRLSAAMLAEAG